MTSQHAWPAMPLPMFLTSVEINWQTGAECLFPLYNCCHCWCHDKFSTTSNTSCSFRNSFPYVKANGELLQDNLRSLMKIYHQKNTGCYSALLPRKQSLSRSLNKKMVNYSDITETEMEVEESEEYSVSLETKLEKVWEAMSTIIDRGKVDHQNTKVNETKLNVI